MSRWHKPDPIDPNFPEDGLDVPRISEREHQRRMYLRYLTDLESVSKNVLRTLGISTDNLEQYIWKPYEGMGLFSRLLHAYERRTMPKGYLRPIDNPDCAQYELPPHVREKLFEEVTQRDIRNGTPLTPMQEEWLQSRNQQPNGEVDSNTASESGL